MEKIQSRQIETYRHYINMLLGGQVHSVLCYSAGGLGKTFTTINILKELNVEYAYINGVATAVELYKNLHDHNGKVLIIDDVETLFQDDRIINLLKASLWEVDGKREIAYRTSSMVLDDYPEKFEYTGKIVILANEIRGRYDESHKALFSRCLTFHLIYAFDEIIDMSIGIVDSDRTLSDAQKRHIINLLRENIKPQHSFNFRLLTRLISFVKYDQSMAKELFLNSIESDEEVEIMDTLIHSGLSVLEQIRIYREETGNSKATYFRKKKMLFKKKVLSKPKNSKTSMDDIDKNSKLKLKKEKSNKA